LASEILDTYVARINRLTEDLLGKYNTQLSGLNPGTIHDKEFNDPVWGTIRLNIAEVIVLDSPIVQRLRRIRQLGVGQFVYPGANHTRLEHSLGVSHQVQRLTESIKVHSSETGYGEIGDEWVGILRMAALCHDIGHGLMSHVVENALKHDDKVVDLTLDFMQEKEKDVESQLSEIAAYYMLKSPAMVTLISQSFRLSEKTVPTDFNERMADCIIGVSNDEKLPLIHEVISGPFDCDKLDYMTRDATMCGVPIVTDVTRLIQKVRATETRTDKLPPELADLVTDVDGTHIVIGVARSGASTLHEVSLGRSLMHDKIYRHHKVRATEAMVASIVSQVGPLLDEFPPMIPFAILDDEFMNLDVERLKGLREAAGIQISDTQIETASDVAARIRNRQLFVRAFAFAQKMPFDAYKDDGNQREAIEQLIRDTSKGSDRREFVLQIVDYLKKICATLGLTPLLDAFPNGDPEPYIWIDPPRIDVSDASADQSRAYLISEDRRLVMMSKVSAETRGWADAYINTRDVGYVFCPREIADLVHIASEIAVRVDRMIIIPREMHSYAKVEPSSVTALRSQLAGTDFYDGLPRDLRPVSSFLSKAGTTKRLETASSRLSGYMGPAQRRDAHKAESGVLNPAKIRDWVAQFPDEFQDKALIAVESMLLLDRRKINDALVEFLGDDGNERFRGSPLVPIGSPKDGSALLTYFAGDSSGLYGNTPQSLPEALSTGRPLVFIDDIIGQGSSVISIFENWLNLADTQGLREERGTPLTEVFADTLRTTPIAIVTSAARTVGLGRIREFLVDKYHLDVTVHSLLKDSDIPRLANMPVLNSQSPKDDFLSYCQRVGEELLDGSDNANQRGLGYGNEGVLVISAHNTPTMTLTMLWKDGIVEGTQWRPLMPRKPKR
jgi:HD superfamily phosphohydrolase